MNYILLHSFSSAQMYFFIGNGCKLCYEGCKRCSFNFYVIGQELHQLIELTSLNFPKHLSKDKSQQEQIEQDESKQQALQLKQYLSDLFLNKRRPSLSTLRKHQAHLNKQKQQIQNEALISMECKSSFQTPSTMSREVVVVNIADEDSKPDSTHHAELEEVEDRIRVEEVDRPLNNQLRYFLVSSTFIERWKKCCK